MDEREIVTLDYAAKPCRRVLLRRRLRRVVPFLILISAVAYIIYRGPRTSADIRLDTGDLRYRYFGIPLVYHRMPEPQRSRMLSFAAKSSVLTPEWHFCEANAGSRHELTCQDCYGRASDWAAEDPMLGRFMAEDLATYIRQTGGMSAMPSVFSVPLMLGPSKDWREQPEILFYMQMKNYTPPTTQPSVEVK